MLKVISHRTARCRRRDSGSKPVHRPAAAARVRDPGPACPRAAGLLRPGLMLLGFGWIVLGAPPADALVNGEIDSAERYPAAVALIAGPRRQCSGAKIGEQRFLTAAHCVLSMGSGKPKTGYRVGDPLQITNAVEPESDGDLTTVTISATHVPPDFRTGLEGFLAFKAKRFAHLKEQYSEKELTRRTALLEAKHHFTARYPDAAVIEVDRPTPRIPVIAVDLDTPLAADTAVTLVGYGCAQFADRGKHSERHPYGRRRWAETRVIRVNAINFFTYAQRIRAGAPSLCPGDSGGPVLRDGKVVGVHGTVYGLGSKGGARSNMAVHLSELRRWPPLARPRSIETERSTTEADSVQQ